MKETQPEIYIHVGLGRAGSTFLQHRVFPKFRKIKYFRHTHFRGATPVIKKGTHPRYLVSGEMDHDKLERTMQAFSADFPQAKPIIVLRRHDEWIASQFRRFIKSGHSWHFRDFFDIEHDTGAWKQDRLFFFRNIEILQNYYHNKPLVLFYDDLKADPRAFVERIARYCNAEVDTDTIDFSPKHASYSEKQLRAVYTFGKKTNLVKKKRSGNKILNVLDNLWINIKRYGIIYLAPLVPGRRISQDPIFPGEEELREIRERYAGDWQECVDYVCRV